MLGAVAGLLALAGVGAFALWPRPERVTRENYERIQNGMNRAEVEAVLGPPGDYRTGPTRVYWDFEDDVSGDFDPDDSDFSTYDEIGLPITITIDKWEGNAGRVKVLYDETGRSVQTSFFRSESVKRSTLEILRWRAKRQWRRWFP